jgi:hypothetical protein
MNFIPPIVQDMLVAGVEACEALKDRISNVRLAPYDGGNFEQILFEIDNKTFKGTLKGRNRDFCVGFGEKQDKSIALRVWLDNDVEEV